REVKRQGLREQLRTPIRDFGVGALLSLAERVLGRPTHLDEFCRGLLPLTVLFATELLDKLLGLAILRGVLRDWRGGQSHPRGHGGTRAERGLSCSGRGERG